MTLERSLKVIQIGTVRKLGGVSYSPSIVGLWPYLLPLMRYSSSKYSVTLKTGLFKVIENGAVR